MSVIPSLPLNTRHVALQFARRSPLDQAQFLYGEIAQRMLQRLSYIRMQPKQVLDAGCGAGHALEPLRARYADIDYTGLDICEPLLEVARQRYARQPSLWQKLRNKPTGQARFIQADLAQAVLPPNSQDLIWSNMALHWHPEPHRVFAEWLRLLRTDGLLMFSCLGPASFGEIRQALADSGRAGGTPPFVDMHDFGDLLVENGFADPVMDQETLTLTYSSPEKLLNDLRALGGNASTQRAGSLPGRAWRDRLLAALNRQRHMDGSIHLTLEVAYGHAWRPAALRKAEGETRIAIDSIRRKSGPAR